MFWRRRLPHWVPENSIVFVTWRLAGCPYIHPPDFLTNNPKPAAKLPERPSQGTMWLARSEIADTFAEALLYGEQVRKSYELIAWVVMATHVHVVLKPTKNLSQILCWLKRSTSVRANKILGRTGEFWAREYWDRWVRDEEELFAVVHYVEYNPVRAGLVANPEDWQWSSANKTGSKTAGAP